MEVFWAARTPHSGTTSAVSEFAESNSRKIGFDPNENLFLPEPELWPSKITELSLQQPNVAKMWPNIWIRLILGIQLFIFFYNFNWVLKCFFYKMKFKKINNCNLQILEFQIKPNVFILEGSVSRWKRPFRKAAPLATVLPRVRVKSSGVVCSPEKHLACFGPTHQVYYYSFLIFDFWLKIYEFV